MLTLRYSAEFRRDYKRIKRRGYDLARLKEAVKFLADEQALPPQYKDHGLTGKFRMFRECHIAPDWLLVYRIDRGELILLLLRTGTHSDLFQL